MNRPRLSIIIYVVLVFLSGVLVGALGHRSYTTREVSAAGRRSRPSPDEFRRRYTHELQSRLKLSEEQVWKLDQILDSSRDRFGAEMRAIQEEQTKQIRALLNPQQQQEYDKMRQEREHRRRPSKKRTPGC